ncbi:cation-translocating P-type ATPase [Paenibacillus sp. IB182496]|uniref:P-type Cu(+) transporter n=1 Tax=Paenibacillus sabuli TaxID=2772509 RepID=A0A927BV39_9BACL|nr:cation-translocating P-type ATPase [Paenibacillus sabuli]
MQEAQIQITGMTCAACSARIEKVLSRKDGIRSAEVSLALGQAVVRYEPARIESGAVFDAIERLGYGAHAPRRPQAALADESASYRMRFWLAFGLSVPLLWAMLAQHLAWLAQYTPSLLTEPWLQWGIASLLQFGVGYPFYYGAYQALRSRSANMDTLVVISTTIAYFYSHYHVFRSGGTEQSHAHGYTQAQAHTHGELYFDAIAMILCAVLLGKWLEALARGRALRQLEALYELREGTARRVIAEQTERVSTERVPAERIAPGDRIALERGEAIAADGLVERGAAEIDEAMLTGESAPVLKRAGDRVYAGTRCTSGGLIVRADRTYRQTRLTALIDLVERAQRDKPPIQRTLDTIAAYFVPLMLLCAVATYVGWLLAAGGQDQPAAAALKHALAVLLVACPCALGLAAPVSLLIAGTQAARSGVLFARGSALQRLRQCTIVLMDKTGTLTDGTATLTRLQSVDGRERELLALAGAVAVHSLHPLAQAVAAAARERLGEPGPAARYAEHPGCGMEGRVGGVRVCVGSRSWLLEQAVKGLGDAHGPTGMAGAETTLYIAADGECVGRLHVGHRLRADARSAIRRLQRRVRVWMVTGDEPAAAAAVAAQVGIVQVRAGMRPEHKLELIRELQRRGERVAMVGDGINDAPALAAADVGIAMGNGADAAKAAGDIVLTASRLSAMTDAHWWSEATMRNVRQNLCFALLYNGVAVPLAASGQLEPRLACLGMAASSVLVVGNALRLQRMRPQEARR